MRILWEEQDITAGLWVIKNSSNIGCSDTGFALSVTFKIGFLAGEIDDPYTRVSITDGMTIKIGTKQDVVKMFNEDKFGYRPLTKEELIQLLSNTDQGLRKWPY